MQLAQKVLLGGLALQVITFGIFLFVAIAYDVRSVRAPATEGYKMEMRKMRKLWNAFYITGVLITLRSIYRTIGTLFQVVPEERRRKLILFPPPTEFGSIKFQAGDTDPAGYVLTHEWIFYVFDAVPIFVSLRPPCIARD